ncbi:APC family permease [Aminipila terrae]|uniref:Amino acid permease n=1 Tax=Aminipila terrae TaxID=2697030 RepID=A0A6P1M942_9FIRM|nr:APC family permease [Aminipila terrae]QHI71130.1 amino acid permease [Aminipila terrae]
MANNSKKLSWVAGLSISLGVPMLILPSIVYFTDYMWAFSIVVWGISILQGFVQNLAYAEMAVDFPDASGLPGYSQKILGSGESKLARFIGGFSAWSYWFGWGPIPAIFILSIVEFLTGYFNQLNDIPQPVLFLLVGTIVLFGLFITDRKGLENSAMAGYVLNIISLLPLVVLAVIPFISGSADLSNITNNWIPPDFTLDFKHIILLFGIFGMAEWSACAWETAAVYGPEYRNPKKDVLKAICSCGIVCLVVYILVQMSCIAVLGVDGVMNATQPPMLLLAKYSFGRVGVILSIIAIIVAMVSVIQTAFLGASHAMHSMAIERNLPAILGHENKYGTPQNAMIVLIILDYGLLFLGKPSAIVAASAIGYSIANGLGMYSYVKYKKEKNKALNKTDGVNLPRIWCWIGLIFAIIDVPLYIIGLIYINSLDAGWSSTIVAVVILLLYIPLYIYSTYERKHSVVKSQVVSAVHVNDNHN